MMKHDKETVKDRHVFSHQECGCINYDYGIIIRMIIDTLIDAHRNTTNKHGGDMYGV